jgi:hypothetical protein
MAPYSISFRIGERIMGGARIPSPVLSKGDPSRRPVQIYALDPGESARDGSKTIIRIPYEPLLPGPTGSAFRVEDVDGIGHAYQPLDLDNPKLMLTGGIAPTTTSPQFRQQMVYAVCSKVLNSFQFALGRRMEWGFNALVSPDGKLRIRPQGAEMRNAFYDKNKGELCFGYYTAGPDVIGRNLPNGRVYTSLSHDVVAHEVTHAILDGLRTNFVLATGVDVLAFHEAFADLVALFHHFTYQDVVLSALRAAQGQIDKATMLTGIASQFGHTTGSAGPLRSAIDPTGESKYDPSLGVHELGSVLVSAVFDAFRTIYERKTEAYIRLATAGTGVLVGRFLPNGLDAVLAHEASVLAQQFLNICIRAIDYCPAIDLEFGEFLRAVITADSALVQEDEWSYREALITAFGQRKVYPTGVESLSEDALLWSPPERPMPPIPELAFAELRFRGDPGNVVDRDELIRQARALGLFITDPQRLKSFGLCSNGDPRLRGDTVEPPIVESIRSARRTGPNGEILFDLVAEVTQVRRVTSTGGKAFDFLGACTIIIDPDGAVRYVIYKSVLNDNRLERQQNEMGTTLADFWETSGPKCVPTSGTFQRLHFITPV